MPDNIPVRISGFVKKNTAHRETIYAEKRADQARTDGDQASPVTAGTSSKLWTA